MIWQISMGYIVHDHDTGIREVTPVRKKGRYPQYKDSAYSDAQGINSLEFTPCVCCSLVQAVCSPAA